MARWADGMNTHKLYLYLPLCWLSSRTGPLSPCVLAPLFSWSQLSGLPSGSAFCKKKEAKSEKKKKKKRILSSISSHQAKDLSPTRQGVNESPSTVPLSRHKAKVSAGLRVGISKQPVDPHLLIAASNYHGTTSLCM